MGLLLPSLGLNLPALAASGSDAVPDEIESGVSKGSGTPASGAPGAGSPAAPKRPSDKLDAQLGGEIDALTAALDEIHDDAVARPLRAALQKVVDGRVTAASMAEAKRVVALNALIANARKQRPAAEAARKHAKALESREAARKEIEVTLQQVTALVLGGIDDDALRNQVNAELGKAQADFAKADKIADLAKGEKALLALKPAATALLERAEKAKGVTDWLSATWRPLLAKANATVAAVAVDALRADLQARIAALEAEVKTRVAAADLAALQGTSEPALKLVETNALAVTAFESGYAAIKAQVDDAALYHGASSAYLTARQAVDFGNAKSAVDAAVARADWVAAKAALPALKAAALAVLKSRDDRHAYNLAMDALSADRTKVQTALASPGLPPKAADAYRAGFAPISDAETKKDWQAALAAVPGYKKALQVALEVLKDGKKFYAIYDAVRPEDDKAQSLLYQTDNEHQTDEQLSAAGSHYAHYKEILNKAVAEPDWGDAKDVLADLQIAAREFIAAEARHAAARAPYDNALRALNRRSEAERVADPVAPPYAATAAAYLKQRQIVYYAADSGEFSRAIANLPLLQTTIDALMVVKDAQSAAKATFDSGWGTGDYAEAHQVAAAKVPALADSVKAFLAADKAVEDARKLPDWVAANAALPALQAAATKLVQDKASFNGAAKPEDAAAFDAKLKALEPRTNKAGDAPVPPFIDTLQKTVVNRLADIKRVMEADPKDLAAAEASYAMLLDDLAAMEAGKARLAAHQARFNAMKNGEIKTALAVALTPAALSTERAAAIAKTEAAIVALAGSGDTAGADARLAPWALEAKGWEQTQKAFAELHNGKVPSVDVLAKLAEQPGGDQALDDLILNMPPNTPAKVLGAALKARFGFEVKRLVGMNADVQNLKGLQAHDPEQKDPELVAMYKLLSQIPSKRIKGKIKELVDFDFADGGGVYYGGGTKKIYTHAGTIGDPNSSHTFARKDEILPKGQEVEENCKPEPKAPPMPQADHTLLHETAHAEDDGIQFMEKRWDQPEFGNWHEESPKSIAKIAAAHLRYDQDWIQDVLEDKGCKPPKNTPKAPKGVKPDEWEQRRQAALLWCQSIRADNNPWWKGAVCARIQIGGRVYQEAYDDGRWRSYDYSARARGISGYQFRAPAEWFAELYAAYFGGKLKPSHPAMSWLKQFQPKKP
ncbi:MAG: hypothetical protein ACXWIG_09720 [Caldimonas sp.]